MSIPKHLKKNKNILNIVAYNIVMLKYTVGENLKYLWLFIIFEIHQINEILSQTGFV